MKKISNSILLSNKKNAKLHMIIVKIKSTFFFTDLPIYVISVHDHQ